MKIKSLSIMVACALAIFATNRASAADSSLTEACNAVQECVDGDVPVNVAGCFATNTGCTITNQNRFAVTAGELADRAIETKRCNREFTNKAVCNFCYQQAKKPLRNRFYTKLFKGLLANAVSIIEQERKTKCLAIGAN